MSRVEIDGEVDSFYEPVAVEADYPPPKGYIDPDPSKSWVRRLAPILAAHRATIALGLGTALLMVLVSAGIPKVVQLAIDTSLVRG
ncbi:MAG: hypothetical protein ACRDI1_08980, partial [Actinomycetota bacterium]